MKEKIIIKTCLKCEHEQEVVMDSPIVNCNEFLKKECLKCNAKKFTISYQKKTPLDFELLKEWSLNPNLFLMPQDEELFLADEPYLDIILQLIDTAKTLSSKRNILLEALCIIVYDNTIEANKKRDKQLKDIVIKELNKRKQELKLAEDSIGDYIKEIVYPELSSFKAE